MDILSSFIPVLCHSDLLFHGESCPRLNVVHLGRFGMQYLQWHQLDHMLTIRTSLQTDNYTKTSSLNFHMPDALSDTQPAALKHRM